MAKMVTVGGVRYRADDAEKLNLTPDTKAYAQKIADNAVPVGTAEADFKAATAAAAKGGRKAAGTAGTTDAAPVGTGTGAGTEGGNTGTGGAGADGSK